MVVLGFGSVRCGGGGGLSNSSKTPPEILSSTGSCRHSRMSAGHDRCCRRPGSEMQMEESKETEWLDVHVKKTVISPSV